MATTIETVRQSISQGKRENVRVGVLLQSESNIEERIQYLFENLIDNISIENMTQRPGENARASVSFHIRDRYNETIRNFVEETAEVMISRTNDIRFILSCHEYSKLSGFNIYSFMGLENFIIKYSESEIVITTESSQYFDSYKKTREAFDKIRQKEAENNERRSYHNTLENFPDAVYDGLIALYREVFDSNKSIFNAQRALFTLQNYIHRLVKNTNNVRAVATKVLTARETAAVEFQNHGYTDDKKSIDEADNSMNSLREAGGDISLDFSTAHGRGWRNPEAKDYYDVNTLRSLQK